MSTAFEEWKKRNEARLKSQGTFGQAKQEPSALEKLAARAGKGHPGWDDGTQPQLAVRPASDPNSSQIGAPPIDMTFSIPSDSEAATRVPEWAKKGYKITTGQIEEEPAKPAITPVDTSAENKQNADMLESSDKEAEAKRAIEAKAASQQGFMGKGSGQANQTLTKAYAQPGQEVPMSSDEQLGANTQKSQDAKARGEDVMGDGAKGNGTDGDGPDAENAKEDATEGDQKNLDGPTGDSWRTDNLDPASPQTPAASTDALQTDMHTFDTTGLDNAKPPEKVNTSWLDAPLDTSAEIAPADLRNAPGANPTEGEDPSYGIDANQFNQQAQNRAVKQAGDITAADRDTLKSWTNNDSTRVFGKRPSTLQMALFALTGGIAGENKLGYDKDTGNAAQRREAAKESQAITRDRLAGSLEAAQARTEGFVRGKEADAQGRMGAAQITANASVLRTQANERINSDRNLTEQQKVEARMQIAKMKDDTLLSISADRSGDNSLRVEGANYRADQSGQTKRDVTGMQQKGAADRNRESITGRQQLQATRPQTVGQANSALNAMDHAELNKQLAPFGLNATSYGKLIQAAQAGDQGARAKVSAVNRAVFSSGAGPADNSPTSTQFNPGSLNAYQQEINARLAEQLRKKGLVQ